MRTRWAKVHRFWILYNRMLEIKVISPAPPAILTRGVENLEIDTRYGKPPPPKVLRRKLMKQHSRWEFQRFLASTLLFPKRFEEWTFSTPWISYWSTVLLFVRRWSPDKLNSKARICQPNRLGRFGGTDFGADSYGDPLPSELQESIPGYQLIRDLQYERISVEIIVDFQVTSIHIEITDSTNVGKLGLPVNPCCLSKGRNYTQIAKIKSSALAVFLKKWAIQPRYTPEI